MAGKIFINYRRDDSRSDAARIHDRLAMAFGEANVFMDVDNLLAGQRFDKELEKALDECDVFLAVIGPRWMSELAARAERRERDYVEEEIAAAIRRGTVVIPVMLERTPLPRQDQLPESIRPFVLHQKHDVVHESFGRDIAALIIGIKSARKIARQRQAKPWGKILGGAVAALVTVFALFMGSQQMSEWKREAEEQAARADAALAAAAKAEEARAQFEAEVIRTKEEFATAERDRQERLAAEKAARAAKEAKVKSPQPAAKTAAAAPPPPEDFPPPASGTGQSLSVTLSGAPGDGDRALLSALRQSLSQKGYTIADRASTETYRVDGKVKVAAPANGQQTVEIEWIVKDKTGTKLGTVAQKNDVPQGSLDGSWGKTADAAAVAAANGVIKLLPPISLEPW